MNPNEVRQGWEHAEDVAPAQLSEARVQLHYALQVVADAGRKLAGDADTDFLPAARGLATGVARGTGMPFRVALGIADFALVVTDAEGKPGRRLPLAGKTLAEAVAWLRAALDAQGADGSKVKGDTGVDLPPHKLADGAPFSPPGPEVWRKLCVHFANAWRVLTCVSEMTADCSPPRCSPETLAYEGRISPVEGVEIAIGFRPGDAERDEPYLYLALAPRPDHLDEDAVDELEELEGGGEWTDEEWFGAVLPGSAFTVYDAASAQAAAATAFFDSALEQTRGLLRLAEE